MSEPLRILLVDDDPEALEMLCEFLADEGYLVETASDGRMALSKLEAFAADLLVTDYEMPGMSGDELIRFAQERRPGQPALMVSAREDCEVQEGVACLQKPIDLDELVVVVRKLIAETRASPADHRSAAVR